MSASIFLIPLAIGIAQAIDDLTSCSKESFADDSTTLNTRFNDSSLLLRTLEEYGLCPKEVGADSYRMAFADGEILFERPVADAPFTMTISNVKDKDQLKADLDEIEHQYNGNVQEYTYQRVLQNLPEGMTIDSEQVLDDDSIMITLTVG